MAQLAMIALAVVGLIGLAASVFLPAVLASPAVVIGIDQMRLS